MENELNKYIPKDLVNIVADFAIDNENYERVMNEFNIVIYNCMFWLQKRPLIKKDIYKSMSIFLLSMINYGHIYDIYDIYEY